MGMTPDWPSLIHTRLFYGRDRALKIGDLAEAAGIARRTVEAAVQTLREQGVPICTGSDGVWLTDSAAELREQYASLRRRYIHQAIGARQLLRTARRFEKVQQMELAL